ncbi:MAG: HAMP domain-containing sensor histidine kinase [Planctomycetota bacterium]
MSDSSPSGFRSLRIRLLIPLLTVALLASVAVALGSYWIGDQWAKRQALTRYDSIESNLAPASFLVTSTVVESVAELTETELIAVNSIGIVFESSIESFGPTIPQEVTEASDGLAPIELDDRRYLYRTFARRSRPDEADLRIVVLFDENQIQSTRLRAALLPLVTGLSTVILLTFFTVYLTNRLLRRLARLQSKVDQIALGNFDVQLQADTSDEIGLLGRAVAQMGMQLESMWQTLNRQQGQKLLHQVAGGLAHQLRNSLTGARMAIELHQQQFHDDDESLNVALSQLEQTESHVRRLLLVASGKQERDEPQRVDNCLDDIRSTIDGTAKHLRVTLSWTLDPTLNTMQVLDGPTLHAAVTNLAINAMEEATVVEIFVRRKSIQENPEQENPAQENPEERTRGDVVEFEVIDNGKGPPDSVAQDIFEPFVTSKPEGLGLGLPLVMRAAQRLGGEVNWSRENDTTRFTLTIPVSDIESPSMAPTSQA